MPDEDPNHLVGEVDRATGRLLDTAAALSDAEVAGPSLLPGWTRGHVLAHVARNADGLVNLLDWARTGVRVPQYPNAAARQAGIEAGAPRPAVEQVADVRTSAARFAATARTLTAGNWAALLELPTGPAPAARVAWRRLREVEVHHVDLNAGYTAADWPQWFSGELLAEIVAGLSERGDVPQLRLRASDIGRDVEICPQPVPVEAARWHGGFTAPRSRPTIGRAGNAAAPTTATRATAGEAVNGAPPVVTGPAYALAAWLAGRSPGTDLHAAGPLPPVPAWI